MKKKKTKKAKPVKAWGWEKGGKVTPLTVTSKREAIIYTLPGESVIRVEIRKIQP